MLTSDVILQESCRDRFIWALIDCVRFSVGQKVLMQQVDFVFKLSKKESDVIFSLMYRNILKKKSI